MLRVHIWKKILYPSYTISLRTSQEEKWVSTPKKGHADFYAGKSSLQVKVEVVKHKTAKDLRPLYDAIQPAKQIPYHPLRLEAEFVFLGGTKLRVIKKVKEKWEGGKRITYYTEEI